MAQDLFLGASLSGLWANLNGNGPLVVNSGFAESPDQGFYAIYRTDTENGNFNKVWAPTADFSGGRLNLYLRGGASNDGYEMRLTGDATNVTAITLRKNGAFTNSTSFTLPHAAGLEYTFEIQPDTPSVGTDRLVATVTNGTDTETHTFDDSSPLTGGFAGIGILEDNVRVDSWADVATISTTYLIDIDGDNSVQAGQTGITINGNDLDTNPSTQAVTLGGEVLTITNWNNGNPIVDVPANINLGWGGQYQLAVTDDGGTYTLNATTLEAPAGWNAIVLSAIPDTVNEDSFYELAQTDSAVGSFTMEVGDILAWTDTANMTVDSLTRVTIDPPGDATGTYKIYDVSAGSFTAESTFNWLDGGGSGDVQGPVLTITGVPASITNTDPFSVNFNFDEDALNFDSSDVSVTNGALSNFVTVSASSYTATITPDGNGDVTVSCAPNAAEDATGNPSFAASETAMYNPPDTTVPVITLLGSTPVNLTVGDSYTDSGATASDNVDGDITANIVVGGDTVDPNTVGSYTITYNVSDAAGNAATQVTRTVNVSAAPDTEAPVLTLVGSATQTHTQGQAYTDQGANWTDNVDGSGSVTADTPLDVNTLGAQTLRYNYTDAAGNAATEVTRTVTVEAATTPQTPEINITGGNTQTVQPGATYTDPTVSATDSVGQNVTGTAAWSGDVVDTNAALTQKVIIDTLTGTAQDANTISFARSQRLPVGKFKGLVKALDASGNPVEIEVDISAT